MTYNKEILNDDFNYIKKLSMEDIRVKKLPNGIAKNEGYISPSKDIYPKKLFEDLIKNKKLSDYSLEYSSDFFITKNYERIKNFARFEECLILNSEEDLHKCNHQEVAKANLIYCVLENKIIKNRYNAPSRKRDTGLFAPIPEKPLDFINYWI